MAVKSVDCVELAGVNEKTKVDEDQELDQARVQGAWSNHSRQSVGAGLSPVVDCLAAGQ
jgi:hypothetical protein